MKCFIHPNKESVAACKNCGKAMCVDCSSFSSHSGICPACRKKDLDKEMGFLKREIQSKSRTRRVVLVFAIFTFFLIIPVIIYRSYSKRITKEIALTEDKIANIERSLSFVNQALNRGSGELDQPSVPDVVRPEANPVEEAWQCNFCRTINQQGRTCKFCARPRQQ